MPLASKFVGNSRLTSETGQRFYDTLYREKYEPLHRGKYLAIDVESGKAGLGETLSEAIQAGQKVAPEGWFYTIRIGYPSAVVFRR